MGSICGAGIGSTPCSSSPDMFPLLVIEPEASAPPSISALPPTSMSPFAKTFPVAFALPLKDRSFSA